MNSAMITERMTSFSIMPFTYLLCTHLSSSRNMHYMRHMTTAWVRAQGHTHRQRDENTLYGTVITTETKYVNVQAVTLRRRIWTLTLVTVYFLL